MYLRDGFLREWCFVALWDVQEIKVHNKHEAVSTSGLELEAEILGSIPCLYMRKVRSLDLRWYY